MKEAKRNASQRRSSAGSDSEASPIHQPKRTKRTLRQLVRYAVQRRAKTQARYRAKHQRQQINHPQQQLEQQHPEQQMATDEDADAVKDKSRNEQEPPQMHLLDLPMETLRQIATYLSNKGFVRFISTCRHLRHMGNSFTAIDRRAFEGQPPKLSTSCFEIPTKMLTRLPLTMARGFMLDRVRHFKLQQIDKVASLVTCLQLDEVPFDEIQALLFKPADKSQPNVPASKHAKAPQKASGPATEATTTTTTTAAKATATADSQPLPESPPVLRFSMLTDLRLVGCDSADTRAFPDSFPHLTSLTVSHCHWVTSLPVLPSLRTLRLNANEFLNSIPAFPRLTNLTIRETEFETLPLLPKLDKLDIGYIYFLERLPPFPRLTNLRLVCCSAITAVSDMPALSKLFVHNCSGLGSLSSLPRLEDLCVAECFRFSSVEGLTALRKLNVGWHCGLHTLPYLPRLTSCTFLGYEGRIPNLPQLQQLSLSDSSVGALPEFPRLCSLSLHMCKVEALPPLRELRELTITLCEQPPSLAALPSLHKLTVENTTLTVADVESPPLPDCPATLQELCLKKWENPELQLAHAQLTVLTLQRCRRLTSIPAIQSLHDLTLIQCKRIKSLPHLANLEKLTIHRCKRLKAIPSLPGLTHLEARKCFSLTRLSDFPSLKRLELSDMSALRSITNLPKLESATLRGISKTCVSNVPAVEMRLKATLDGERATVTQ